jgi:uncharacterized protein (UPF0332 family)
VTSSERLRDARESIAEGTLLRRESIGSKPVLAKYYHAMMNSLLALFGIRDIGRLTHADIIERFEREHVRAGTVDGSVFKALRRSYDLTHECECDHMPVPTEEEVEAALQAAEGLVLAAEQLLRTEVKVNEGGPV